MGLDIDVFAGETMSKFRFYKDIKNYPVIDGWLCGPDGFKCTIGDYTVIGDSAVIGDYAKIGDKLSPVTVAFRNWTINHYAPGVVRVGCRQEPYQFFYDRTESDWASADYSNDERETALAIIRALETLDPLVWRKEDE